MRDSTAICIGDLSQATMTRGSFGNCFAPGGAYIYSHHQNFLDSPSTTSATTYKIQVVSYGGGPVVVNRSTDDTNNAAHGTTTSTITVMEIKG
jgi:hypothetical protein